MSPLPKGGSNKDENKKQGLPVTPNAPRKKAPGGLPSTPSRPPRSTPPARNNSVPPVDDEIDDVDFSDDEELNDEISDDFVDDDSFEDISFDEQEDLDDEEERVPDEQEKPTQRSKSTVAKRTERTSSSQEQQKRQARQQSPQKGQASSNKVNAQKNTKGKGTPASKPKFVDEENAKLKTFGRKQKSTKGGTRRAPVAEFDERKNLRKKALAIQIGVIGLLGIMAGCGVKNAVLPPPTLDEADVMGIVNTMTGETGFPHERGAGFAEDFIQAYMDRRDDPISSSMLSYFYTGSFAGGEDSGTLSTSGNFQQQVMYGPTVYDVSPVSANSASFLVGVAVSVSGEEQEGILSTINGEANVQWRFFNVNVYYNEEEDSLGIAPDSPTLMPSTNIVPAAEAPVPQLPGTGAPDTALTEDTATTIRGYIEEYANASAENPGSLSQYINAEFEELSGGDPMFLTDGLDGEFELDGDAESAIEHQTMYMEEENDTYAAAIVRVQWRETPEIQADGTDVVVEADASAVYESTYAMRLIKDGNNWTVTRFSPFLYSPEVDE